MNGQVTTGKLPNGLYTSEHRTFEVVLRLRHGKAVPIRWHDTTSAEQT